MEGFPFHRLTPGKVFRLIAPGKTFVSDTQAESWLRSSTRVCPRLPHALLRQLLLCTSQGGQVHPPRPPGEVLSCLCGSNCLHSAHPPQSADTGSDRPWATHSNWSGKDVLGAGGGWDTGSLVCSATEMMTWASRPPCHAWLYACRSWGSRFYGRNSCLIKSKRLKTGPTLLLGPSACVSVYTCVYA